jgi:hypothetical protein
VEAPAVFTRDRQRREALTTQLLKGVAARAGPPLAVAKADDLAAIGRRETDALRDALEEALDAERDASFDDRRQEAWMSLDY